MLVYVRIVGEILIAFRSGLLFLCRGCDLLHYGLGFSFLMKVFVECYHWYLLKAMQNSSLNMNIL